MFWLAKKMRFVGCQEINRDLRLVGKFPTGQDAKILAIAQKLMMPQSWGQPTHDQGMFVVRKADCGDVVDPTLELVELLWADRLGAVPDRRRALHGAHFDFGFSHALGQYFSAIAAARKLSEVLWLVAVTARLSATRRPLQAQCRIA